MSGTTNHQAGVGSMTIKRRYDSAEEPDATLPGEWYGLAGTQPDKLAEFVED